VDEEVSAYFQAPGLTPAETMDRIHEELRRVTALIAIDAGQDRRLVAEDARLIHQAVFEPVFGEQTLPMRWVGHPGVTYPVWKAGQDGKPESHTQSGNAPRQLRGRLRKAFDQLDQEVVALQAQEGGATLLEAVLPAAKIYAEIVALHPWEDGNGRTAWLVMTHTLIRSGLLAVATQPTMEARLALGHAITRRRARDPLPLAEHLANTIKASSK
jgi:fido (protein-threonine AMPylation protein)